MNRALANALREKEELRKRLAEIDEFLRLYERFSDAAGGPMEGKSNGVYDQAAHSEPISGHFIQHGPDAVVRVCTAILQDFGVPLTRGELAAELEARRVRLPGKDKENRARYVGTILWRNQDRFENIEGKGYWLKGIPIPDSEAEKKVLRQVGF
jgi:hypothetical protein